MAENDPGGHDHGAGGSDRLRASLDRAVTSARAAFRRTVGADTTAPTDETEGRIRHLETALDAAYEQLARVDGLSQETARALDHQGARLEALQQELQRIQVSVERAGAQQQRPDDRAEPSSD